MSDLDVVIFVFVAIIAMFGISGVLFDAFPNLKKTLKKPRKNKTNPINN